jgi:hypothetical protein
MFKIFNQMPSIGVVGRVFLGLVRVLSISPRKLENRGAFGALKLDLRGASVLAFYEWLQGELIFTVGVGFTRAFVRLRLLAGLRLEDHRFIGLKSFSANQH